jgi:hypothetical protein
MRVGDIYGGALKADDLGDKDIVATIDGGELRELEDGDRKIQIKFREALRPLILNKTNARQIAKLHGEEASEWVGKRITLYATTCDFAGKAVGCIRIRDEVPPEPSQQPQQATSKPGVRF